MNSQKTPLAQAAAYINRKPRTEGEVERFLAEIGVERGQEMREIIRRLKDAFLIDDVAFAEEFVLTRLATKPLSRRMLREQLIKRLIKPDTIAYTLEKFVSDDVEERSAMLCAQKCFRMYQSKGERIQKNRTFSSLIYKGFDTDMARRCVEYVSIQETGV